MCPRIQNFNYPRDLVEILDVTANLPGKGTIVYNAKDGILRMAWFSLEPMQLTEGNSLSNSPNPFSLATAIEYGLPEAGRVSLAIYNTLGEQVANLVNETQDKGRYKVTFDGSSLAEGVYFARFSVDGLSRQYQDAIRMVLIR